MLRNKWAHVVGIGGRILRNAHGRKKRCWRAEGSRSFHFVTFHKAAVAFGPLSNTFPSEMIILAANYGREVTILWVCRQIMGYQNVWTQ